MTVYMMDRTLLKSSGLYLIIASIGVAPAHNACTSECQRLARLKKRFDCTWVT